MRMKAFKEFLETRGAELAQTGCGGSLPAPRDLPGFVLCCIELGGGGGGV